MGVAVDQQGNILVTDFDNNCVSRVAAGLTPPALPHAPWQLRTPPAPESSFHTDLHNALQSPDMFHDVTFVVDDERVPAHRVVLASRCEYFRSMFSDGFQESSSSEIQLRDGISAGAFKALLRYLYTDSTEVEDGLLVEMVKVCDQYQVERLRYHCMRRLDADITHENAIGWLVQAHTMEGVECVKESVLTYVAQNYKKIIRCAKPTLVLLDVHPGLFKEIMERWGLL